MNAKEQQREINRNLNKLDKSYHFKEGVLKINKHNTLRHELAKFIIFYELSKNGLKVYSEAIFKNKRRADIYDPLNDTAIEITESETEESKINKKCCYPCMLKFFKADKVLKLSGVRIE